ncbi:MAG TPA: hypothetical protein ENK18_03615 [Deltaproteobacteria bacterium]|nr:hypothetical protein [Deltaproteobacteria bacterium]
MRRWLPFVLPFLAIVLAGAGVKIWLSLTALPPCAEHTPADLADLELAMGCVVVSGQAHYEVVVKQTIPGNLLLDQRQLYLFPLFPEGRTQDRAIRVLVRTDREPEDLVSFETMTVSGRLIPVTTDEVPFGTEVQIGKRSDYFFTDEMLLLVPDQIISGDEVWPPAEPQPMP